MGNCAQGGSKALVAIPLECDIEKPRSPVPSCPIKMVPGHYIYNVFSSNVESSEAPPVVIDVRSKASYDKFHIRGITHWSSKDKKEFPEDILYKMESRTLIIVGEFVSGKKVDESVTAALSKIKNLGKAPAEIWILNGGLKSHPNAKDGFHQRYPEVCGGSQLTSLADTRKAASPKPAGIDDVSKNAMGDIAKPPSVLSYTLPTEIVPPINAKSFGVYFTTQAVLDSNPAFLNRFKIQRVYTIQNSETPQKSAVTKPVETPKSLKQDPKAKKPIKCFSHLWHSTSTSVPVILKDIQAVQKAGERVLIVSNNTMGPCLASIAYMLVKGSKNKFSDADVAAMYLDRIRPGSRSVLNYTGELPALRKILITEGGKPGKPVAATPPPVAGEFGEDIVCNLQPLRQEMEE